MGTMRKLLAGLLLFISVLSLTLGVATLAVRRTLLDTDRFVTAAVHLLDRPEVRDALAERFVERAVAAEPALGPFREPLGRAVRSAVESDAFRWAFSSTVAVAHESVVQGEGDEVALGLRDVRTIVMTELERIDPSLPDLLPSAEAFDRVVVVDVPAAGRVREVDDVSLLAGVSLVAVGLLALVAGVLSSQRRWRALAVTGVWLFTVAVLLLGLLIVAGVAGPTTIADEASADALEAAWDVALADVRVGMVILAVLGLLLALASFLMHRRTRVVT
jgi:hypothetical protein